MSPTGGWGHLRRENREVRGGAGLAVAGESAGSAGARLQPVPRRYDRAWWSLCASGRLARVHAKSRGLLEAVESTQLVVMPGLVARAAYVVGKRFLVGGGLQASFPVSPDRYVYRDSLGVGHSAFELSPLLLSANFGVGLIVN